MPQKSNDSIPASTPVLDNPKSVSIAWPFSSRTTFSGFKSLKMMQFLWRASSARIISATYILATYSVNLPFLSNNFDRSPPGPTWIRKYFNNYSNPSQERVMFLTRKHDLV